MWTSCLRQSVVLVGSDLPDRDYPGEGLMSCALVILGVVVFTNFVAMMVGYSMRSDRETDDAYRYGMEIGRRDTLAQLRRRRNDPPAG